MMHRFSLYLTKYLSSSTSSRHDPASPCQACGWTYSQRDR